MHDLIRIILILLTYAFIYGIDIIPNLPKMYLVGEMFVFDSPIENLQSLNSAELGAVCHNYFIDNAAEFNLSLPMDESMLLRRTRTLCEYLSSSVNLTFIFNDYVNSLYPIKRNPLTDVFDKYNTGM